MAENLLVAIEDEMRQSYMDYAMSVIVGRALPDARDGLKPVHRRVLYAMYEAGNVWNRAHKKSARTVGDVIGKYHPHGDAAVYDTIVRLAQDFSLRYPLIDGQGNFGSIDGDPAAAMRYTEIRMARIADQMLADIDKETVDFGPNYDDSTEEPLVLPARIPNLLINGSSGIAVGMATNIPPHNLGEVVDALVALIETPTLTVDDLLRYIPGPDFPTAGFLHKTPSIAEAYRTGRGVLQMRARAEIETDEKTGRSAIIVTELPYQVNKAKLIERMAELVNEKRVEGISDLRDESDRQGMRVVVELKRDAVPEIVLNQLYKHTQMQESFGVIMLAIVAGRPKLLNLKEALQVFLDHRKEVVTRRTAFELRKARERLHILEGLKIAIESLDAIIQLIRSSPDRTTARDELMRQFGLSQIQAQAILEMRLQQLTSMERDRIIEEHAEVVRQIVRYEEILGDEREVLKIIKQELQEVRDQHADPRRTVLITAASDISIEDMIADEDMVVTISHHGYIKRSPVNLYRSQKRGGRGKIGAVTKEEDFVENIFVASTHTYILVFTTKGKLYWIKVHELPQPGRTARGKPIVNLLNLLPEEKISAFLPVREFEPGRYVLFATRQGRVKKTSLGEYANPRPSGIIAILLQEDDEVIGVRLTNGSQDILLSTRGGLAIRFFEEDVRPMGRTAGGVKGIQLDEGDAVVAVDVAEEGRSTLTVSERGYGKRTELGEYRKQGRGGRGLITLRVTDKTGPVVGVRMVRDEDDLLLITDGGTLIRTPISGISVIGRNTQGVRLMGLGEGEKVVGIATLSEKEAEGAVKEDALSDEGGTEPSDGEGSTL